MSGLVSDLAIILGGVVAGVLAILGYGKAQKRKGKDDAERDAMQDAYDRVAAGRDAVRDGRDGKPDERVSDNDARW